MRETLLQSFPKFAILRKKIDNSHHTEIFLPSFQSTYKSNLEGYTTQLATEKDSEEYRKMEANAARLANEIEGSGTNKLAIELENGDEEEAFSAVVRSKGGEFLTFFSFFSSTFLV